MRSLTYREAFVKKLAKEGLMLKYADAFFMKYCPFKECFGNTFRSCKDCSHNYRCDIFMTWEDEYPGGFELRCADLDNFKAYLSRKGV